MENQSKKNHNEDYRQGNDLTQILLTLELVRSFRALWKSKQIILKFDNRKEMTQFVSLMELYYAIEEDILEEEENARKKE